MISFYIAIRHNSNILWIIYYEIKLLSLDIFQYNNPYNVDI